MFFLILVLGTNSVFSMRPMGPWNGPQANAPVGDDSRMDVDPPAQAAPPAVADSRGDDSPMDVDLQQAVLSSEPIINLHLDRKPKDKIVHSWCLEVVHKRIKNFSDEIFRKIGVHDLALREGLYNQEYKKYLVNAKDRIKKIKKRPVPPRFLHILQRLFNRLTMQVFFGYSEIKYFRESSQEREVLASCITINTEKYGTINFYVVDSNISAYAIGKNIVMGLSFAKAACDDFLEGVIAHELGHIYFRHEFKLLVLIDCLNKSENRRFAKQRFKKDMYLFRRLQEVQADIFGVCNDLIMGKNMELDFRKRIAQHGGNFYFPFLQPRMFRAFFVNLEGFHPANEQRVNLVREINLAMEKEKGIIFNDSACNTRSVTVHPRVIFQLGKLELDVGEFKRAYDYFNLISCNRKKQDLRIQDVSGSWRNYALGCLRLSDGRFSEAVRLFRGCCASKYANNVIRVKSFLQLGRIELKFNKNLSFAKKYLCQAACQESCSDTKKKADAFLRDIKRRERARHQEVVRRFQAEVNVAQQQWLSARFFAPVVFVVQVPQVVLPVPVPVPPAAAMALQPGVFVPQGQDEDRHAGLFDFLNDDEDQ